MYLPEKYTNLILSSALKKTKVTHYAIFIYLPCFTLLVMFCIDVIAHVFNNNFFLLNLYIQKRFLRKLRHMQFLCWTDLMFASLLMGKLVLVKHLPWKGLKVLVVLTIEF
jgi:hypothetical protein